MPAKADWRVLRASGTRSGGGIGCWELSASGAAQRRNVGPPRRRLPAALRRMHHLMMEFYSLDDVGQSYDIAQREDVSQ
jgi:hypothetical protein